MRNLWLLLFVFAGGLLVACAQAPVDQTPAAVPLLPSSPAIPATFTPAPPGSQLNTIPVVTVTQAPPPTVLTSTPIPFGANVVELRLTIPSIGYDRRLQGSVNSQIILVDESNGFAVQRDNQASVLLDLQRVLPELVLAPLPDNCDSCTAVSFSLPFSGVEAAGWLQDPVLLASLENYFTITLGPHFPDGALVGLRRSASPYAPAHTLAVMPDGRLFRWLANDDQLPAAAAAPADLLAAFEALDVAAVDSQYVAPCPGSPLESLFLAGRQDERLIVLVCPEFALDTDLQPLYVALNAQLEPLLASSDTTLARPPAAFPLDAALDYQRIDGARLTIFLDNTAVATTANSQPITTTLSSSQVISLTTSLLASGSLHTGLTTFLSPDSENGETAATATPTAPRTLLLVRGPAGVYDAQWFNTADAAVLAALNELLAEMFRGESTEPDPLAEPTTAGETAVATPTTIPPDE